MWKTYACAVYGHTSITDISLISVKVSGFHENRGSRVAVQIPHCILEPPILQIPDESNRESVDSM